jgi:hypothetical protein
MTPLYTGSMDQRTEDEPRGSEAAHTAEAGEASGAGEEDIGEAMGRGFIASHTSAYNWDI